MLKYCVSHVVSGSRQLKYESFTASASRTCTTRYFPPVHGAGLQTRLYASRTEKSKSPKEGRKGEVLSAQFVPGSQRILTGEAQAEYDKVNAKMTAAVDWLRKELAGMETRGTGRVTPDVLSPVKVTLPGSDAPVKLDTVATVGVRDGTSLLITVFDADYLKYVERAIYAAKIPHVVPQKIDSRTIKIPMPKPTIEAREALAIAASKQAEETRVQLRKFEQAGVKKGKYEKHSRELEEFRKLLDKQIKDVDKTLADMKKNLGAK